jgi:hypothetical protein
LAGIRVATSLPGENYHNTLVLGDIEVVLPMEVDEEALPKESVRLRAEDGSYQAELKDSGSGVERDGDNPLNYFHFLNVPSGRYVIEVQTGDQWHIVLRGVDISQKGAFVNGVSWEDSTDGSVLGTPDSKDSDELMDFEEPRCGNC